MTVSQTEDDDGNVQERCLGHVGQSGSGKTYALEEDTLERHAEGRRIFVFDQKREWTAIPAGYPVCEPCITPGKDANRPPCAAPRECVIVPDLPTVEKRFKTMGEYAFVVLRRPRDMRIGPPMRGEIPLIERIAFFALNLGGMDIVIPEAQIALPLEDDAAMGIQTRQLITQFRSYGIGLAYDTQQFASVSMKLRKQTNAWRFFGVAEGTPDLEQMRKVGGKHLVAAILQCSEKHAAGQPGYHVYVDPRVPISGACQIERY